MSLFNQGFKPLKTPSYILRVFIIIFSLVAIFSLSLPFFTMYLAIDVTLDHKMTQAEVDETVQELNTAFDNLVALDTDESTSSENTFALSTLQREWYYTNISSNVDITKLIESLDKCMDVDSALYTEESYEALTDTVLAAQEKAGTCVKLSQTAIQMIFCGNIAQQYADSNADSTGGLIYVIFTLFPAVIFFVNIFDRKRHIKNIATLLLSSAMIILILLIVSTQYLDTGSLISIFTYMLLIVLGFAAVYAKQQEDYIVKHPELEAEFTEKHPHFTKALLNAKRFDVILADQREQERAKEQKPKSKKETKNTKNNKSKTKKKK